MSHTHVFVVTSDREAYCMYEECPTTLGSVDVEQRLNVHDDLLAACVAARGIIGGLLRVHSPEPVWVELAAELDAAIGRAGGVA
jgi:hypothetical protein